MAHVRITLHYADDSAVEIEVGHEGGCHPDLLDELASRALVIYGETVGDAETEADPR